MDNKNKIFNDAALLINSFESKIAPAIFTRKQLETIRKKLNGKELTQVERNYLSKSIKQKFEAMSILYNNLNLNDFLIEFYRKNSEFKRNIDFSKETKLYDNERLEENPLTMRMMNKLLNAKKICILTGSGISKLSGLPIFRGDGGLWTQINPNETLSEDSLKRNPGRTIRALNELKEIIKQARPNINHKILAKFEKLFDSCTIITQNIDNLHNEAGSTNIIELHGNILQNRKKFGHELPDVTLYNEGIDQNKYRFAYNKIMDSDFLIIIGTSGYFDYLQKLIKEFPGTSLEINPEKTEISELCTFSIRDEAEIILPKIYSLLVKNKLLKVFRKWENLSRSLTSVYLYGSILNEQKFPNDIDIMVITDENSDTLKKIIGNKVENLTGLKADIQIYTQAQFKQSLNNYKRHIISKGVLLRGKNIEKEIINEA